MEYSREKIFTIKTVLPEVFEVVPFVPLDAPVEELLVVAAPLGVGVLILLFPIGIA